VPSGHEKGGRRVPGGRLQDVLNPGSAYWRRHQPVEGVSCMPES